MAEEQININLPFVPYQKRIGSTFGWTFLLYFIIAFIFGFKTDLGTFLLITPFLALLFVIDYSRRLAWVKYSISTLNSDLKGVKLTYLDKDEVKSADISWDSLNVSKGSTFTKSPIKLISIQNGTNKIGSFYANDAFDNTKIDELYKQLVGLKTAYSQLLIVKNYGR